MDGYLWVFENIKNECHTSTAENGMEVRGSELKFALPFSIHFSGCVAS